MSTSGLKNLLILAYDFPPYVSVGGLRPYSWYKYLPEFGIHPIVVTRQWKNDYGNHLDYIAPSRTTDVLIEKSDSNTIIRTPYRPNLANKIMLKYGEKKFRLVRKMISFCYEMGQWLWMIGPKFELYQSARQYMRSNKVDIIIASGDPFILFRYASRLGREFGVPWIADYRDPWVETRRLSEYWKVLLEKKIVSTASKIITTIKPFQELISRNVPKKEIILIPNGYDPESINLAKNTRQNTDRLSIAFMGTIQAWHPIESFLKVCSNYESDLCINFYGINLENEVQELVTQKFPAIKHNIKFYRRLENHKLAPILATNNLFLLFNDFHNVGTKIYDYIGLKRKILFCYTEDTYTSSLRGKYTTFTFNGDYDDLQVPIIQQTGAGIVVQNELDLDRILREQIGEFSVKGKIECNSHDSEKFSRKYQAKKLADLLKSY